MRATLRAWISLPILMTLASPGWAAPGDKKTTSPSEPNIEACIDGSPEIIRRLLKREHQRLQSERAELQQLRVDLKAAETELDKKLATLQAAAQKKAALLDKVKKVRQTTIDDKIQRLVSLTEKMPPVEAAAYLTKLDSSTASKILQGMRLRQASKVMAALSPKKAAALSRTYLRHDEPIGRQPDRGKSK